MEKLHENILEKKLTEEKLLLIPWRFTGIILRINF